MQIRIAQGPKCTANMLKMYSKTSIKLRKCCMQQERLSTARACPSQQRQFEVQLGFDSKLQFKFMNSNLNSKIDFKFGANLEFKFRNNQDQLVMAVIVDFHQINEHIINQFAD